VRGFGPATALADFLAASRVLVNLLPLTPDTRDILNRHTCRACSPGAT
jgi:glyoxylate/hydroxypyruvate reductase A